MCELVVRCCGSCTEESLETLKVDIESLSDAIKALDKSVVEQTEQRKEENQEYAELLASDTAAKELLEFAKNRLQKFYNPASFKCIQPNDVAVSALA